MPQSPPSSDQGTTITPRQIVAALDTIQPRPLAAVALTRQLVDLELAGNLTAETMLNLGPAIEAALRDVEQKRQVGQRISVNLISLKAQPGHKVPVGF